jgi:hypothetical protein
MGCGIEPRKIRYIAGAEGFYSLEGNMCGTVLRGAVALPGSKATSRAKGSYRDLGDLIPHPLAMCLNGPCREGEEPTPAMYGGEKSDRAIVAMKPANKAERSPAESVERRARAEGSAVQHLDIGRRHQPRSGSTRHNRACPIITPNCLASFVGAARTDTLRLA